MRELHQQEIEQVGGGMFVVCCVIPAVIGIAVVGIAVVGAAVIGAGMMMAGTGAGVVVTSMFLAALASREGGESGGNGGGITMDMSGHAAGH
ncbi:hypothetical protein PMPD1_0811 [Paramixta manurensis]|uniref:Uncharacterized protein n=1 Tax=Paramixta manurensis TaxID=2740817 RepID=A0A6M8UJZ0_9GAMM|nr:hypothetical protein PMPD1_0811 [Erwiniaceae bacterium PD-1]